MANIATVWVEIVPQTAAIADGIKKALLGLDGDVRKAARRWDREIERELKDVEVAVDADTTKAKKEIQKVEKGDYTAKVKVDLDRASVAKVRSQLSGIGGGGTKSALGGRPIGEPTRDYRTGWRPPTRR